MKKQFENLLMLSGERLTLIEVLLNLAVCIIASYILLFAYNRNARTVANKRLFSQIFPLYSIAIFGIITVIQSSLALSLGLVGALSIIRFRTAIKEPEQLIYLLMATGIAIGSAAGQLNVVGISLVFFVMAPFFRKNKVSDILVHQDHRTLNLVVDSKISDIDSFIVDLKTHFKGEIVLINLTRTEKTLSFTFTGELDSLAGFEEFIASTFNDSEVSYSIL